MSSTGRLQRTRRYATAKRCNLRPAFLPLWWTSAFWEGQMSDESHISSVTRRAFVAASAGLAASAAAMPVLGQAGGTPRRVIIDTDPGVDDAFALLLAMRSPELRIEGITPVAGNVPLELTLPNALRMVEIAGRTDIPVAAGATKPLERRLVTATYAHGENGLGGAVFPAPKLQPIADPAAEFNIYVDPEAARIVFQSGIPLSMVGLDVTRKTALTETHVQRLEAAGTQVGKAAATIARNTINHNRAQGFLGGPNMHDPLAMAAFLDPSLLTWKDYYVDIEIKGELTAGETVGYSPVQGSQPRRPDMAKLAAERMAIRGAAPTLAGSATSAVLRDKYVPNTRVAMDVDSARFFELLIGRLAAKS